MGMKSVGKDVKNFLERVKVRIFALLYPAKNQEQGTRIFNRYVFGPLEEYA
jgi:uncharacterized protein with von Willebrand factor type A (vWA) domain